MKTIFKIVFCLCLALFQQQFINVGTAATVGDEDKLPKIVWQTEVVNNQCPNVVILYVNNSKTTYDDVVDYSIKNNLDTVLDKKYNKIDGSIYMARLSQVGIVDLSMAERVDIIDAFDSREIDYAIYVGIEPLIIRDKITFFTIGKDITTVVALKIIDIKNNKYLYNGKFSEKASDSSMVGGIGNKSVALKALEKINLQIKSVVETRLSQEKNIVVAVPK